MVVADSGDVLPIRSLGGHIIVHQKHLKQLCAVCPIDPEVLCEKASIDKAHSTYTSVKPFEDPGNLVGTGILFTP